MLSKRLTAIMLPIVVLGIALFASRLILANKPEPATIDAPVAVLSVAAVKAEKTQYQVLIRGVGTIRPTKTQLLVPEVAGTVVGISDSLVVGGRFNAGDLLVELDARDYEIALTQAKANLAQAEAQLLEQQALASQAVTEWQLMGGRGAPSSLTLREPQLAAAEASRDAAEAQYQKAGLDLERTRLYAPYDGIVGARSVEIGQYAVRGTALGQVHNLDTVELSMPLSSAQMSYVRINQQPNVMIAPSLDTSTRTWEGELLRIEGVDPATQQLNVVARVYDPYGSQTSDASQSSLRLDQFVEAMIYGNVLHDVIVVPQSAMIEGRELLLVKDDQIKRLTVTPIWSDANWSVIADSTLEGQLIVVTPLNAVAEGTPVAYTLQPSAYKMPVEPSL